MPTTHQGVPRAIAGLLLFGKPRALTAAEVEDVIERFASAARVCAECGFDGIQIHAAHGYLLSSFHNPLANNRVDIFGDDDPFGGSLENRARCLLETVRAVRKATRRDFAVSVKLNSADFQQGGFTTDEAAQVAGWLEEAGCDLLEVSGGNYESVAMVGSDVSGLLRESTKRREGYFIDFAVAVQKSLRAMPLMVTGGWRTRTAMEAAVAAKEVALIGVARPMCGDPLCCRKLLSGDIDALPSYESTLQVGHWTVAPLVRRIGIVYRGGQQYWFYMQLLAIAETGSPNLSLGCLRALLKNLAHEARLASETEGVDSVGVVYRGLRK